jgi:oxygen-independent coproporphyrinogen-3 oxidase
MNFGVYIHIPFCEQRCYYCAFTVAVSPAETYEPYVRRLTREIELSGFNDTPDTVFFGGGTPSIIDAALLETIVRALPGPAREVTIETNPGTIDEKKIEHYRRLGVNRISLGVQSFCDEDLRNAGRLHTAADVLKDYESLRRGGFDNIGVDLIAGLPNQRKEIWSENLDWLERLRPDHVSIYMLDREERSAWGRRDSEFQDDEVYVAFYNEAAERLARCGYEHYEISNWALPGFQGAHNLKYWSGAPYRGFGVSAHSYSRNRRFWNTSSLKEYTERIDAGMLPTEGEEQLTTQMRLEEAFMLGLRQVVGFDIWSVAGELGIRYPDEWFDRVGDLEDAGWIQFDGKRLRLTPSGWMVATGVTEQLLIAAEAAEGDPTCQSDI